MKQPGRIRQFFDYLLFRTAATLLRWGLHRKTLAASVFALPWYRFNTEKRMWLVWSEYEILTDLEKTCGIPIEVPLAEAIRLTKIDILRNQEAERAMAQDPRAIRDFTLYHGGRSALPKVKQEVKVLFNEDPQQPA